LRRVDHENWLPAQNEIEAIAAFFTTGVADEKLGFGVIGRTYCRTVELNYDLISLFRDEKPVSYWKNTVELYLIWRPRLSKAEMSSLKDSLQSKIAALGPDNAISPIGLDQL
jgi:hypothetical protein